MPDKKCPQCGLWSTSSAILCDCGYNFYTGISKKIFPKLEVTSKKFPFGHVSLFLGLLAILTTPFLMYQITNSQLRDTAIGKISLYLFSDWRFWLLNLVSLLSSLMSLITGIIAMMRSKAQRVIALVGILTAVMGLLACFAILTLLMRV